MSITVTPTSFDLGKIEQSQSTTSFFTISTPNNETDVLVSSNNSFITLRKGNTGSFTSSITTDINNEEITINIRCMPTTTGIFNGSLTITNNGSTVDTVTYTFNSFPTLENYSDIYAKGIYARDGIFNANTIKIGTSSISMTEQGDKLNFKGASGITYNIGSSTQLDDGRIVPLTMITVNKIDNSILVKNNLVSTMKIDQDGTIRSSSGTVILSADVTIDTDEDWKLERDSGSGSTALYKRQDGTWIKRVSFS